ncbi:MAG: ATP-binding cassette domain-containing protein [Planctomycetota bacterium]
MLQSALAMLVEVERVYKRYDDITAVDDVSLTIERGELLGLIGPNGAGKTSLMKMIATLAKPDRGRVRIMGRDARLSMGPIRRRLGYMPAEFGKMPEMTVVEYLSYFGAAAGVPRRERERRINDVLELVDLVDRSDSLVGSGSTGIKQRILIAKTLVHDPELLILDEPAAGLDPRARIEIREVLKELNSLGKTIVVSSHILADLEEICDHVAIMEHGRLVTHGSISGLTEELRGASTRIAWALRVVAERRDETYELLAALPDVSALGRDEGGLRFQTPARDGNFVLAALLAKGITVLEFKELGPRLEDVFMRRTEGAIS